MVRLLVRFSIQLDQPVHVVEVSVDSACRVTMASATGAAVVADRAASAGFLVTSPSAAATSRRHSRTSVARGQSALAHQRAGKALPPPVPGHDQENGYCQQYDDSHQHTDDDRHIRLVLVFGGGDWTWREQKK